jgi:dethiobiotin synthetase
VKKFDFFITGTDTGIGKTIVSTTLAVGLDVHYWKPIQTGSREGTDSDFVRQWIGIERVVPESYVFPEALSPHLAAESEGIVIDPEIILRDFLTLPEGAIIEGAGGVLVPIHSSFLMIDLIRSLERSTIIVTSTRLGTINHTLLTLESLKARGVSIAGFVTVGTENTSIQRSIEQYGATSCLGHIPHCEAFSVDWFQAAYRQLSLPNFNLSRTLCKTT